jgi:hypothetical protein
MVAGRGGNENFSVGLYVLDEAGTVTEIISAPELNPLGPLKQVAGFLHQYVVSRHAFKRSMVPVEQGGTRLLSLP